jgi:glycosyltransferase involved in cell wall biosynthesis
MSKPPFDCVLVTQVSATAISPAMARALGGAPFVLRPCELGEFTGEVSRSSLARLPLGGRQLVQTALQAVRRLAYRQAKVVVAPSEGLVREAQQFGFPPDSILRVPNPVDTTVFRPVTPVERRDLRVALGIPVDAEVVTFSGRLVKGKGVLTLAQAWKQLIPMHPKAILIVVGSGPGSDSPLDVEQTLRGFLRDEFLEDRVIMPGSRPDVERYLGASDLFVFPSGPEGVGNSLIEAMACGLPVICGMGEGSPADLVQDGENGFKFETGNASALCARIHELLLDKDARACMGAAGRRLVEQRPGVEVAIEAYEQALRKAIELG